MEIKVQCDCGQKFKFDVEPVNGQVPFVVKCPVCGMDGTARANVILQQLLPPTPIASTIAPPPISIAASSPAPAPAPTQAFAPAPAPIRPAGLSINRLPPAQQAAPAAPFAFTPIQSDAEDETEPEVSVKMREITLGWKTWLVVGVVIVVGLVGSYKKWSKKFTLVKDIVGLVSDISGGGISATDGFYYYGHEETVFSEDDHVLLVQSTNAAVVATTVAEYWAEQSKERLSSTTITNYEQISDEARFVILPERQGGVRVEVDYFSDEQHAKKVDSLTKALSGRLSTLAVCEVTDLAGSEEEDASTYSMIIYQRGEKMFQFDHRVRFRGRSVKETSRVTGEAWAKEMGFRPGLGGFSAFSLEDAEKLAQLAGFKPSGTEPNSAGIEITRPLKCGREYYRIVPT